MRPGQVGVHQQPGHGCPAVVPLDAAALAAAAGLGGAGVADIDQFGIEVELPQRQRALQARQRLGAQSQLQPCEATSGGTLSTASPVLGSTAAVVPRASLLWKPRPALKKSSVLAKGPAIRLSLGDHCVSLALPLLAASVRAVDLGAQAVGAHADHAAQPRCQLRRELCRRRRAASPAPRLRA
jgi:hypothetical protein